MQLSKKIIALVILCAVLLAALATIVIQIKQSSVILDDQLLQPKSLTLDKSIDKKRANDMIRSAKLFYTFWDKADAKYLTPIIAANFTDNMLPTTSKAQGIDGLKLASTNLRKVIPDLHCTIEDLLIVGDKVSARIVYSGTFAGPFMGIKPTNKPIKFSSMDILRFKDGKIIEGWHVEDVLPFLQPATVLH